MKYGDDETKEHEYYFRGANDVAHMTTLTNRRLVVTWGNAEHSYPISKITAIKIIFNRTMALVIWGVILVLLGLGVLSNSVLVGLVIAGIGAIMVYFGWMGKTNLQIGQMGGNEFYTVRGKANKELRDFVDMVNSKLS